MDNLRAQHCFDQIEAFLNEIKDDVTGNPYDPEVIEQLNDKVAELESDLEDEKGERETFESKLDDAEKAIEQAIKALQDIRKDISFQHPLYSLEDLDDVISNLESI
jgi:predicted  nucleic acid-binding Zn-ribbon protein